MSTEDPEKYLAVLKASYDYTPQSDDEIAIQQEQQLLLVEKVDEDWWKVKIIGSAQDSESQIGLVPAAYVEQAPHTSVVKALYDYEASAPGELTVHEDDVLLVFAMEEDWILVQDSQNQGKAGYVPGTYVEVVDEDEPKAAIPTPDRIIVPDSPTKPVYVDPADRVASTKVTADDIKTWSISEVDKKGKKKKGTLGIGNGSLFFASESDKTPVRKWQSKDVTDISSEKSKHIQIDIGGPNPVSLHFQTVSKEHVDAILDKLQSSRALTFSEEHEKTSVTAISSPSKKPSVHFSPASPTIIPEPEDPEEELEPAPDSEIQEMATALYDFGADGEDELTVKEGEKLIVLEKDGEDWWKCRNAQGLEGVVPASYLEVITETSDFKEDAEAAAAKAEEQKLNQQKEVEHLQHERDQGEEKQLKEPVVKAEAHKKAAKHALVAVQAEGPKKKDIAAVSASVKQSQAEVSKQSPSSLNSSDVNRPSPENTRIWHDRTGQFRVEAAFLGFNNGKLRLHKTNGVIVEVPSEKMSLDDMRYVEKLVEKKTRSSAVKRVSDDDIPLAYTKNATNSPKGTDQSKKSPKIDWFDFFLSAGCDVDDCTRYSVAFERDKVDDTLLNDITEGTMRSLGLREGDIIRVKKAIEKRKPTDNLQRQNTHLQEQIRRDEELARQLQAQENAIAGRNSAPNLFAGPGGVLKPRRGRPQPSKTLPPTNVDLNAISSASGQIKTTGSPSTQDSSSSSLPPRPYPAGGFEDDAWTNRPSSTMPAKPSSPSSPAAPIQPSILPAPATAPQQPTPTSPPKAAPSPTARLPSTETDIFDQLARLSELRKNSTPQQAQQTTRQSPAIQPPGFQSGMGMGPSPLPISQLANSIPPVPSQPYNGPRGPFAPVPANQGLLQPLIPTQTSFGGFIPTKPNSSSSPFQNQPSPASFLPPQLTGFQNPPPVMTHSTAAFGNFGGVPSFPSNTGNLMPSGLAVQSQPTGFNSPLNPPAFGGLTSPPVSSNLTKDTSPASVFAQMKSGTFANEDNNGLNSQAAGWGQQTYQGYIGH